MIIKLIESQYEAFYASSDIHVGNC